LFYFQEVSAISLLQLLKPSFKAYLVDLIGENVSWNTEFVDEKRRKWHDKKMRSKDERPAAQMAYSGIKPGHVMHISLEI
jgi:hypothetical protein